MGERRLLIEGFVVRPVIYSVDLETGTIEARDHGQQAVKPEDLAEWADEQWPTIWENLQAQFADDERDLENADRQIRRQEARAARASRSSAKPKTKSATNVVPISPTATPTEIVSKAVTDTAPPAKPAAKKTARKR